MTAVAAANYLTPSAVSQQLATLENEARSKLFEPLGRRVKLTSAGLRLAAHAQVILDAVEAARIDMGIAMTTPSGRLEIACFGTFAKAHALPAIVSTMAKYPDMTIILREVEPVDALIAVRNGTCDAAIVYAHNLVPRTIEGTLVSHALIDEPMLLALPERYGHLPEVVGLDQLAGCDWIGGVRETEGYTLTGRACATAGFAPRITHSVDDYELLLRMVAAGLGISFVPQMAFDLYPTSGVVVRASAGPPLRRSISVLARPVISTTPSFVAYLDELCGSGIAVS